MSSAGARKVADPCSCVAHVRQGFLALSCRCGLFRVRSRTAPEARRICSGVPVVTEFVGVYWSGLGSTAIAGAVFFLRPAELGERSWCRGEGFVQARRSIGECV
jgi:hypothetical protein